MGVFEYIAAFVAIVMGLAVARVMSGIGAFIIADHRVPNDWLLAGWCLALIITMIGWWMLGWFTIGQLETVTYGSVLVWFSATALLFLAGYILLPGGGLSPSTSSSVMGTLRPSFFVCLGLHFSINIVASVVDGSFIPLQGLVVLMVILSAIGAFLRSTKAHSVLLVVWVICMLGLNLMAVPAVGENSGSILEGS